MKTYQGLSSIHVATVKTFALSTVILNYLGLRPHLRFLDVFKQRKITENKMDWTGHTQH